MLICLRTKTTLPDSASSRSSTPLTNRRSRWQLVFAIVSRRKVGGGAASATQTGTVFAAAANHLCASGVVRPINVARYRSLLVRDAEGASDPNIYDDAEEHPGALIIEFAFADAGPPTQAQIEAALRCWRNPHGAGCSTEDVGP